MSPKQRKEKSARLRKAIPLAWLDSSVQSEMLRALEAYENGETDDETYSRIKSHLKALRKERCFIRFPRRESA